MDPGEHPTPDDYPNPEPSTDEGRSLSRRQLLGALGGVGVTAGIGKALDNVVVGYGVLTGTNLVDQELTSVVDERFRPRASTWSAGEYRLQYHNDRLTIVDADNTVVTRLPITETSSGEAAEWDDRLGLTSGPIAELIRDLTALNTGDYRFAFSQTNEFFETIAEHSTRPYTVGAIRGGRFKRPAPSVIERFTGANPADPAAIVTGLKAGFREYSGYDMPRYAAGSVQDNVIFDLANLRKPFRSPTDFSALLQGENTGLFCYEFAYRSIEALHAVTPIRQQTPVAGAVVTDSRHKHVYTGIASAVRREGDLVIPMTFVDYTHSTLYDDLNLRGVLGEGLEAYNRRHRTDNVFWNRYARWR